jgi:predicted phosphodiesterase
MDFQIISDIHLEVLDTDIPRCLDYIIPKSKILVLAGDIGSIYRYNQLKNFLTDTSQYFDKIIYVLGNHEYYDVEDYKPKTMEEIKNKYIGLCNEVNKLIILDRTYVIINNICIAGCTLWSKAEIKIPKFIVKIHDINTLKYNELHQRDLQFINEMINTCKQKEMKLVIITHHAPSNITTICRKKRKFGFLYSNNLEHLLDKNLVHTWVFGHNHVNFDVICDKGCRIVSNQKGKLKDRVVDFSYEKIIKI